MSTTFESINGVPPAVVVTLPEVVGLAVRLGADAELLLEAPQSNSQPAQAGGRPHPRRVLLRILDDFERDEKLRRLEEDASVSDREFAAKLAAARHVLRSDPVLSPLLPAADADCWPLPRALSDLVRLRAELVGGVEGQELLTAFALHSTVVDAAGLHSMESTSASDGISGRAAVYELPAQSGRSERWCAVPGLDSPEASLPIFAADVSAAPLEISTIVSAPVAPTTADRAPAVLGFSWNALTAKHRSGVSAGRPVFYGVEDFIAATKAPPQRVIQLLGNSSKEGHKLRLRPGVFVTRIEVPRQVVVVRNTRSAAPLHESDVDAITAALGADFRRDLSSGRAFFTMCTSHAVDDLKQAATSAVSPIAEAVRCEGVHVITPALSASFVSSTSNFYFVVHGPKVRQQLPPFADEVAQLRAAVAAADAQSTTLVARSLPSTTATIASRQQQPFAEGATATTKPSSSVDVVPSDASIELRLRQELAAAGGSLKKAEIVARPSLSGVPQPAIERLLKKVATYTPKSGWTLTQ